MHAAISPHDHMYSSLPPTTLRFQVTEYLIADDACEVVLEVITAFDTNVPILRVAYEALGNLGNDAAAAGKLVELGAVKNSSTAIQNFDYEKGLV